MQTYKSWIHFCYYADDTQFYIQVTLSVFQLFMQLFEFRTGETWCL